MKKIILKLSVVIVLLCSISIGINYVSAFEDIEREATLYVNQGWNLFYNFHDIEQLDTNKESIKAIYAFMPNLQEYARVYPNPELPKLRSIDDDELINQAFWVYSDKEFNSKYEIRDPIYFNERPIYKGWNFVGLSSDMVEKAGQDEPNLLDIAGNCDIEKAYLWQNGKWFDIDKIGRDVVELESTLKNEGLIIKVSNNCRLGSSSGNGNITPPPIPGNNGYAREQIENYYYEEFSYEACELNNAKDYNSVSDCSAAWRCLSQEYAKLIPEGDLQNLADYMKEHGGESGSIWYNDKNPSVNQQLTSKYDMCLSGRHKDY